MSSFLNIILFTNIIQTFAQSYDVGTSSIMSSGSGSKNLGFSLYNANSSPKSDPCAIFPCKNGLCFSNSTGFNCICLAGNKGPMCEFNSHTLCKRNTCLVKKFHLNSNLGFISFIAISKII